MTPIVLVNPLIIKEKKPRRVREGCLSLPGIEVEIERPMYVKVKAMDEHWNTRKYTFTGTQAQVARHEIDHLNGILMIDYLEASDREVKERLLKSEVYKIHPLLEKFVS
jgi:peptide deformylase